VALLPRQTAAADPAAAGNLAGFDKLSPRQVDVANHIAKGMTNYQISCELGISENTVKLYVSQVLRATGKNNRTQLALALGQQQASGVVA
jgi:DNA-binding NarL/FixJ family response regulator